MRYDFTNDAVDVRALLSDTVDVYLHSRSRAPDEHPQVTRVELALLPGDGTIEPSLYVDFDVRPEPEADGDADFRCIGELHRPAWMPLFFSEDGLTATFPDGSVRTAPDGPGEYGDDADDVVARFLFSCLSSAHADGVFDRVADRDTLKLTLTYNGNPVWEGPGAD